MAKSDAKEAGHDDIKFSRTDLVDADSEVVDIEREKRNSPLPEQYRDNPEEAVGYPIPEDRKPAVMRADQTDSLDYKLATYKEIDKDDRALEAGGLPGQVARREFNKAA
jgi:hypothetical protein